MNLLLAFVLVSPLPEKPEECYVHFWFIPEQGTFATFGKKMDWEWDEKKGKMLCNHCQFEIYACPESNALWPEKKVWDNGWPPGWKKTWCRDAVWLGQISESEFRISFMLNDREGKKQWEKP